MAVIAGLAAPRPFLGLRKVVVGVDPAQPGGDSTVEIQSERGGDGSLVVTGYREVK